MPIITITSAWRDASYYLPVLKGKIYSLFDSGVIRGASVTDVIFENLCSSIEPFNIPQGCFVLKNSFKHFPKGSIHLMAIDSEPKEGINMVAVQYLGQWIVGLNDGRFSLIIDPVAIDKGMAVAYEIPPIKDFSTFMESDLFVKGIEHIVAGTFASELQVCDLKSVGGGMPAVMEDRIIGKIVYIDSYGNAISNISRDSFARCYVMWHAKNETEPSFKIFVGGPHLVMDMIYDSYDDVEFGADVALFNSAGLLEFAINKGNFSTVEGVEANCEIMIKFY